MVRSKTQTATITHRVQETQDTVTLRLQLPDPFEWEPGQFIMVQARINGESVRRAYSISSSPMREYLEITIRQTEDPTMSRYLNEIEEGKTLEIRGPYGRFIWNETVSEKAFLLGAGSGITPFRAFLQYIKDKNLTNEVTLLYSCGYMDDVIFKDELEQLSSELPKIQYELSLTREDPEEYPNYRMGRIDHEYLKQKIDGYSQANFYTCGSPGFVKAMMDTLEQLGIDPDNLKREQWG